MIRGQAMASRNANDGISLSATAEGALSSINDRLQRIRELTVQGLTGSLNQPDRDAVQAEINMNLKEIDRITDRAEFNGVRLLDGSAGMVNLLVGAYDKQTLGVDLRSPGFDVESLGLKDFYISGIFGDIFDINTLPGSAFNVILGDANTTVSYTDQIGTVLSPDTKLMRQGTSGSYFVQTTDINGKPAHYISSYTSHSDTATRSSTVDVRANLNSTSFTESDGLGGNNFTSGTIQYLDGGGATIPAGSNPVLVKDDTQNQYYLRTQENGEIFYYGASVAVASNGADSTAGNSMTVQIDAASARFSAIGYDPAPDALPQLSLSTASLDWQNQDGTPFSGGANPGLVEAFGQYYVRAGVPGAYDYYAADIQSDIAGNQVTIKANTSVPPQSFNDGDVTALTDSPLVELSNATLLPPGSVLVQGTDNRYYLQTTSGGDLVYTPAELSTGVASDGTATVTAVPITGGLDRQRAAFNTASTVPVNGLPQVSLSGAGSAVVPAGMEFVVDQNGRYYLRELGASSVKFYDARVTSTMNSDGSYSLNMVSTGLARELSDVPIVSGNSTVALDTPLPPNVEVTYQDHTGKVHQNVLSKDADGNYILNLPDYGDGLSRTAALVQVDNLSDHLISQDGDILVRTVNGMGDVVIYYAMSYTSTTDAGNDHTVINITETGGEIRLRQPRDPLAALDRAMAQVDQKRSELGATQNRLESAINNLGNSNIQLSAARSRIEDADYAVEVSNMTRAQILQQAGTAVLAQANQIPRTVLSLLQ